jgi:hypothetical protein
MAVRLWAHTPAALYPPGTFLVLISVRGWLYCNENCSKHKLQENETAQLSLSALLCRKRNNMESVRNSATCKFNNYLPNAIRITALNILVRPRVPYVAGGWLGSRPSPQEPYSAELISLWRSRIDIVKVARMCGRVVPGARRPVVEGGPGINQGTIALIIPWGSTSCHDVCDEDITKYMRTTDRPGVCYSQRNGPYGQSSLFLITLFQTTNFIPRASPAKSWKYPPY